MDMQEIVESTRRAAECLHEIRDCPDMSEECRISALIQAICRKLMIPDIQEENIRNLVIYSIKYRSGQGRRPDEQQPYDCHQTSLVAQKKVLLLMFIEKEMNRKFSDQQAAGIETVGQLEQALKECGKGGSE